MAEQINILEYFASAQANNQSPSLLQFGTREICGIDPVCTLVVKNNRLYKNGLEIGAALDIFEHMALPPSENFFPAFIGFFAYEFSRYWDKPVHQQEHPLPEAFFRLYERGLVIENNKIIHHDQISQSKKITSPVAASKLEPALSREEFIKLVACIKNQIREGDVYQVNLSLPFYFDVNNNNMLDLYNAMRTYNLSPYMGILHDQNWWLLSGSPERLFRLKNNTISARPIAGTKKRGLDLKSDNIELEKLQNCPKESAEHAMLVDLMRNDLHIIADNSGVSVDEDRSVEFYSHVMHLVSKLSAQTQAPLRDIFQAVFPGGTITGAPKISVMQSIAKLEVTPRGPYTGSLGYISGALGADFNILIRSIVKADDKAWINTGAGIVIDSDPEQEWLEVIRKSQALNDILQKRIMPKRSRDFLPGPSVKTPAIKYHQKSHILFIENHDSFSFNIIAAFKSLGAHVHVAHELPENILDFSHVVIGPGPGNPTLMPRLDNIINKCLEAKRPLLGICLGHQALGKYFGSTIIKLPEPVHGKSHVIKHTGLGLFHKLPQNINFTRYHSLALKEAPADFYVDAWSLDDCIMALRHKTRPLFSVQFHPESYLSEHGILLLNNFLASTYLDAHN